VPAGQQVLEALAAGSGSFKFAFELRLGRRLPPARRDDADDGLKHLLHKDAILFGSAGDPAFPTTSRCGACA
jgi:tartrate dehydrogenase/decarboxylase/D-malate dehydrogenase